MRNNNILTRFTLSAAAVLTVFSCEEESSSKSFITSFDKYAVTTGTTAVTIDEGDIDQDADTVEFVFKTSDKQNIGVHLTVASGSSSTATEGVDFDLLTHDVDLLAYQGQDGFVIPVVIYEDYEPEDGNEDIFLTFTSDGPSGVEVAETKVVTIVDSGLDPQPSPTADFEIAWAFASEENGADQCDLDLDLTIQPVGSAAYANDLMDNEAAGSACVEHGTVAIEDMVNGQEYEVNVYAYGGIDYGDLSGLTVTITFARENTTFEGEFVIEDEFDSRDAALRVIVGTLVRNGSKLTLKDADDSTVAEGRANTGYKRFYNVAKP